MRTRLAFLALPLFFLSPPALPAGDKAIESPPALVVQVRSLERVFDQAKLVLSLIGQEEIADKVEAMLRAKIGAGGLEGVDLKKPLGVVVRFGKDIDDISPLVLVPISDEKAFLKVLEKNKVKFTKGKNDVYTVRVGRDIEIELYFRITKGYLHLTLLNQAALAEARLADPEKLLGGAEGPTFSVTARIDLIPLAARQIALAKVEEMAAPLFKEGGGSKAQRDFARAMLEGAGAALKAILDEGQEFRFTLDIDAKSKKLSANASLTAKPGSALAKTLETLGNQQSLFGSLLTDKAAFNAVINAPFPDNAKKALADVFAELKEGALKELTDAKKKIQAQALFAVLEPSFKEGKMDAFVMMNPSAGKTVTYLVALRVKDGMKLEKELRKLVEEARALMAKKDHDKIQLDFAKEGGVSIHRFAIPEGPEFAKVLPILGDPNVYFALRDDAIFVGVGKEALEAVKGSAKNAKPGKAPLLSYRADMKQMASVLAGVEGLPPGIEKLFAEAKDNVVVLRVDGGAALTARVELPLNIFLLGKAK